MAVQVRAVKTYVTAVLALKTKEKLGETQFTTKIDGFFSPSPLPPPTRPFLPLKIIYFLAGFFLPHPISLLYE